MSLPVPMLDDRSFQDIVDECRRMIPRLTPEWTDQNISDPGVTLIELFAWIAEMLLFRMNQVPRRNYIKFLEMIGVRLDPPKPARAELWFRLSAPQETAVVIPADTEVATWRTTGERSIIFATEQALQIKVPYLEFALTEAGVRQPNESPYRDFLPSLRNPDMSAPIFSRPPTPGDALYLGFAGDLAAHSLLLHVGCSAVEGIGVRPDNPPLIWEYFDGSLQDWRPAALEADGTGGLNRSGDIILHIPASSRLFTLDDRRGTWIRCRVITSTGPLGERPGYKDSPRLQSVQVQSLGGSIMARHSEVISVELLGRSSEAPGQTFTLSSIPLLPRRPGETLEVETDAAGVYEPWQEVENFSGSGPTDRHFTCDSVSGQICLGPAIRLPSGLEQQFGAIPPQGRSLRFSRYRIGGGVAGNVGKYTLTQLKTSIPFVQSVTNPVSAVGGVEAETIDSAMLRGPGLLRTNPRAVTSEDYERLALEGCPDIARARCTFSKDKEDGAGRVHLLLVPYVATTDKAPSPEELAISIPMQNTVLGYLNPRRMITIPLQIEKPLYLSIDVRLEVFPTKGAAKDAVRASVEAALYRFLHPTVGGTEGTGWPFERSLFHSDIYALVQAVPGVDHVGLVDMVRVDSQGQRQPITLEGLALETYEMRTTLLCSGKHTVRVR
jgi:predicted phage baseplate assembly protein